MAREEERRRGLREREQREVEWREREQRDQRQDAAAREQLLREQQAQGGGGVALAGLGASKEQAEGLQGVRFDWRRQLFSRRWLLLLLHHLRPLSTLEDCTQA